MSQKTTNIIAWGAVAVLLATLMFFSYDCGRRACIKKSSTSDTTVNNDTILIVTTLPVPFLIEQDSVRWIPTIHDTIEGRPYPVYVEIDTTNYPTGIVQDYLTTRHYKIDTGGVTVNEDVYKNKLIERRLEIRRSDTTIRKKEIYELSKSFSLSFRLRSLFNLNNPFFAQGSELDLNLPGGGSYGLGVYNVKGHRPMFSVSKGWTLNFKRKPKIIVPIQKSDTTVKSSVIKIIR